MPEKPSDPRFYRRRNKAILRHAVHEKWTEYKSANPRERRRAISAHIDLAVLKMLRLPLETEEEAVKIERQAANIGEMRWQTLQNESIDKEQLEKALAHAINGFQIIEKIEARMQPNERYDWGGVDPEMLKKEMQTYAKKVQLSKSQKIKLNQVDQGFLVVMLGVEGARLQHAIGKNYAQTYYRLRSNAIKVLRGLEKSNKKVE